MDTHNITREQDDKQVSLNPRRLPDPRGAMAVGDASIGNIGASALGGQSSKRLGMRDDMISVPGRVFCLAPRGCPDLG